MNITNKQFEALEQVMQLLPHGDAFLTLTEEQRGIILQADMVLLELRRKQKRDNERTAKYIADKRKQDKNYARSKKMEGTK